MKSSALALALVAAGFTACASQSPEYYSHWNPGSLGPRAEHAFMAYHQDEDSGSMAFAQEQTTGIAVGFQRHFLNHNPTNPYKVGYLSGEWPYSIWPVFGHTFAIAREAVYGAARGAAVTVAIPVDGVTGMVVGTGADAVGIDYDGQALGKGITPIFTGEGEPPHPSSFSVKKK